MSPRALRAVLAVLGGAALAASPAASAAEAPPVAGNEIVVLASGATVVPLIGVPLAVT